MYESIVEAGSEMIRQNPAESFGGGILACSIIAMAFRYNIRKAIKKRDGGCIHRGNGKCVGKLEAMHKNHDKNSPEYHDMSNGDTGCTNHHLEDHINRAGENGLSEAHNDWAIQTLIQRLNDAINYKD